MQDEAAIWRIAKMRETMQPGSLMQWKEEQKRIFMKSRGIADEEQSVYDQDPSWWMVEDAKARLEVKLVQ